MFKNSIIILSSLFLLAGCMETGMHLIKDGNVDDTPAIAVDPVELDFGAVERGNSVTGVVTLSSVGGLILDVSSTEISEGSSTFSLLNTAAGRYEPGETGEMIITYESSGEAAVGELLIVSNDPDQPNLTVPLLSSIIIDDTGDRDTGTVVSSPVAVCSVDPSEILAIHESATWTGSSSYDTDGGTITAYNWTLISMPVGSSASMPGGTMNRRNFVPDVAGEYVGELIVTDDDGNYSDPCYATLTATAGEGLWIEMFWTNSGDDMDLHLLDNGGSLTTNSDCYYGNCTWGGLDWGVRGNSSDDPILDLDDIPGVGPENINIDTPARGLYTVYVHDYPGSSYIGRNDVTVNVYIGGSLAWTDTRNINLENCYEPFVEIDLPSGTTSDLSGACR